MNQNQFKIKNKFALFLITIILTIFITRILVYYWKDPNIFIKGLELHHFYYGLILLIITQLGILFGKFHPKLYITLSAISMGLILDESLFIMAKIRGPMTYSNTLFSVTTLVFLIIMIIGIILFDFIGKLKWKSSINQK
jgi:hypothetical protein